MDIGAALIAHLESTKAVEPGERPLDHPPIAPQPLTRLDATPRDARNDASSAQRLPTLWIIVPFIRMQFHWTAARPSSSPSRPSQGWNGVYRHIEPLRVMNIGARHSHRQWHTSAVDHEVALRAQLATIRRILAGLLAPPERAHSRYRVTPASSQSAPHPAVVARACDASIATPRRVASHASAASTSCRSHTATPEGASPRGCQTSRQRRSLSRRRGR
jgi:hypothetical protein